MIVAVTEDADDTKNGVYVRVANPGVDGTSLDSDWKKVDGRITAFEVIDSAVDGDYVGEQIIRITQSNGGSQADTFFDILTSGFAGGGGFRFLELAYDDDDQTAGFLGNSAAFDFLQGDVFRIQNTGALVDGLYYCTADTSHPGTPQGAPIVGVISGWVADGTFLLFHEDVDPGNQLYLTDLVNTSPTLETPEAHGGIDAGVQVQTLQNGTNTVSQILDMILFPPVCPATSNPTATFTTSGATFGNNVNGYYIVGEQVSATFTLNATGGSITGQAGAYAGELTSATLSGPDITGSLNLNPDASYNVDDYTLTNWPVELGANTWTYSATFAAGQDVLDSYGNATCGNYAGGSFNPSKTLYGTYPILLGTNVTYAQGGAAATFPANWTDVASNTNWTHDASSTSSFPLMTASSGIFSQNYTENSVAGTYKRHRIAVPNVAGVNVTAIEFFDAFTPPSGAWIDTFADWTTSTADMVIYGDTITYTIYERTLSSPGGGIPEYRLTF
jgi:hypothetical protein